MRDTFHPAMCRKTCIQSWTVPLSLTTSQKTGRTSRLQSHDRQETKAPDCAAEKAITKRVTGHAIYGDPRPSLTTAPPTSCSTPLHGRKLPSME